MDRILTAAGGSRHDERQAVLLPERMAGSLGIDPRAAARTSGFYLWGVPFTVVGHLFRRTQLDATADLDGEPLTPVIFPSEVAMEMTEVEMDALESGDDVRAFQSRYQHIAGDLTVIVPHGTLLAAGGQLKAWPCARIPGRRSRTWPATWSTVSG